MAAAGLWWQRAVGVLMMLCAPAAHAASQARLVVVPSQRTQAQETLQQFAESLQKPLGDVATVLPTAAYTQAAQKAQLGPNLASGSAAAVLVGTQVNASHILYLRAISDPPAPSKRRRRPKERLTVTITLVDVATGETVLSRRYPAGPKGVMASDFGNKMVADVQAALASTGAPVVALAASQQAQVPSAAASPAAAESSGRAPEPAPSAPQPQKDKDRPAPAPLPTAAASKEAPAADPYSLAIDRAQRAVHGPQMELGVRAQLGLMVFARQATLTSLGVPKLQYGVSKTGSAPIFSRGNLNLEVFPVQFARRHRPRAWVDGIGLHVGGALGWPKTRTSATASSSSLTSAIRAGLTFRHLFGNGDKSPELALRLGYARYAFAVPTAAPFPSLSYSSVYLSLAAIVPMGTPKVSFVAEAALMPALSLGDDGALLGVHRGGGVGAWADAGLKISPIRHLDILAQFTWEHYGADFVGSTVLPGSTQYASVTLRELLMGGRLAVGTTF